MRLKKEIFLVLMICAISLTACAGTGENSERIPQAETDFTEENKNTEEEGEVYQFQGNELFNSQGVVIEILSEGEGLSKEKHDDFLKRFGFEGSAPFYQYAYAGGDTDVELYYDESRNLGCGFKYWENAGGPVVCGYAFNQCGTLSWYYPDPFSCVSAYGTTGRKHVTEYQKEYEYDDTGKLLSFCSSGKAKEDAPDDPSAVLISISFVYDEYGTLRERLYSHNTQGRYPFGSFLASQHSYYDDNMRLLNTHSYTTSGSLDSYFIYEAGSDVPSYYFELDNQYKSWPHFYKIQQNQNNWTTVSLEQEPREGYSSEEEFMTEEEWLDCHGYTEEKLFYEYSYSYENVIYEITLYCEENMDSGGGILKKVYPSGIVQKYAFTFDGCEKYLQYPIGPFNVFSEFYTTGRDITFLQGETITEYFDGLEEAYGEAYAQFGYEADKLMYMTEERSHGCVWRFYIYKKDWEGSISWEPSYLLEVAPGWGVTFHSFGF